jgi:transcriptional regulator of acetoin/glycerol metabolism
MKRRSRRFDTGGNLTQAAVRMGISRQYLYRLLEQHGIQVREEDG